MNVAETIVAGLGDLSVKTVWGVDALNPVTDAIRRDGLSVAVVQDSRYDRPE